MKDSTVSARVENIIKTDIYGTKYRSSRMGTLAFQRCT